MFLGMLKMQPPPTPSIAVAGTFGLPEQSTPKHEGDDVPFTTVIAPDATEIVPVAPHSMAFAAQ
jgi:hypothetical protein